MRSARWSGRDHHPPCPGGCGQLADECACRTPNPLGSMTITPQYIADVFDVPVELLTTEHDDCRCFPPHPATPN